RRRSLGRLAQHTTRTRRHDDSCVRVTLGDFIVDIVPIERPVTDERYDRARHLVEQSADLGAYTEMQFSPGPACPRAMLASRPGELHPGPLDDTPQSGYNTNRERSAKHEDGHVETAPGLRFATVDRPSGRLRFAELVRRAEGAERAAPGAGPDPAGPDRRRQGAEPAAPAAAPEPAGPDRRRQRAARPRAGNHSYDALKDAERPAVGHGVAAADRRRRGADCSPAGRHRDRRG